MGGGGDAGGVEGGNVGGVLEDGAQLHREAVELVLGHVEAGQAGDVGHVLPGDQLAVEGGGHPAMVGPIRRGGRVRSTTQMGMGGRHASRFVRQGTVVVAGLALGLGGMAAYHRHNTPSYQPHPPSVRQFAFPTVAPAGPPPSEAVAAPAGEPSDARTALVDVLQAMVDGKPEVAYPLFDNSSRTRYPTLTSWMSAQANLAVPLTFELGASRPALEQPDTFDFDVAATHRSSLDPFRGLVPARSKSVWEVRREGDAWRVGAEPVSFRPVLPPDTSAVPVVQDWVTRLAACDTTGAASLQVTPSLYGPAGLVRAPCDEHGAWTAGNAEGLDHTSDPKAFLAAFGPDVGTWARLVPVQGPGMKFLAAVAPVGESWQVMGVAVEG